MSFIKGRKRSEPKIGPWETSRKSFPGSEKDMTMIWKIW